MNSTDITLFEFFSLHRHYWFVLLFITFSLDASAVQPYPQRIQVCAQSTHDSLLIKRSNGKRKYIVEKGDKIKIWCNEQTEKGEFFELYNDTLSLNKKGIIKKYSVDDIKRIKIFGNLVRNIFGAGFKIWGGAIIVAGFVPLLKGGALGLIISVPAWLVGWGIYEFGKFISGRKKFNLEKKWEIHKKQIQI